MQVSANFFVSIPANVVCNWCIMMQGFCQYISMEGREFMPMRILNPMNASISVFEMGSKFENFSEDITCLAYLFVSTTVLCCPTASKCKNVEKFLKLNLV